MHIRLQVMTLFSVKYADCCNFFLSVTRTIVFCNRGRLSISRNGFIGTVYIFYAVDIFKGVKNYPQSTARDDAVGIILVLTEQSN